MASRAYGEIAARCFEPYGRWSSLENHPDRWALLGVLAMLTCNERSTMIGLYIAPLSALARGHEQRLRELVIELGRLDLVRWDERFNLIYVPGAITDQMHLTSGRIKEKDSRRPNVQRQLEVLERLIGQHSFIDDVRSRYL